MDIDIFCDTILGINPKINRERLYQALEFATEAHFGQYRKSGEEYITHPIAVAIILAELGLDEDTIISGLLHDVIEDTRYSHDKIKALFGERVANIVEGVTKIEQIKYESKELQQSENFRKMLLAMSQDISVILVKLADRLHNMRTLEYKEDFKRVRTANETLEIYVPIAHRLGIFRMKGELEDLSFKFKYPKIYAELRERMAKGRSEREQNIENIIKEIEALLKENNIVNSISGRPKNFYSIYKKMTNKDKAFEEIHDITAIRVIVNEISDCYAVLGIIHSKWKPIPFRFKDYIAMPKPNMYQSLHTTLIGKNADTFEVQIRTDEMHRVAEYGIAAHWKYKEGVGMKNTNLKWVDQMLEWQNEINSPQEFINSVKTDLFSSYVYVFTPMGSVIELPDGATPVDFAYKIHTDVGNNCVGAKVNGKIVTLNYQLKIGDIVEILTSKANGRPSRDWLNFVKSSQAKNKIRNYFKKVAVEDNIEKGRQLLETELKKYDLSLKDIVNQPIEKKILDKFRMNTFDQFISTLGYGGINLKQIIPFLKRELVIVDEKEVVYKKRKSPDQGILIDGMDDMLVKFAKCCNPIPGDDIIGFITRGSGVTIHRSDCTNFSRKNQTPRFINVNWSESQSKNHTGSLKIIARESNGLLNSITQLIQNNSKVIRGLNVKVNNIKIVTIVITFDIVDIEDLNAMVKKIKNLKNIIEVYRV